MIIYSLVCNRGGMLRVVESLNGIFDLLPDNFPLKIVIMGEEKPFEFNDARYIWFSTDDVSTPLAARESFKKIKEDIYDAFKSEKVDWIIADFMTLACFEKIEAKICYDIHFLGRPFFEAFSRQKNMVSIDQFSQDGLTLALHLQHLGFIKNESMLMKKASSFIVNSLSSKKSLENDYIDVSRGKEITFIPVSTDLKIDLDEQVEKQKGFYFHARYHPQKGIHFLLSINWNSVGAKLILRGIESSFLTDKNKNILAEKGIDARPWSSDSSVIRKELMSYEFILFPSIYEPWGLSLQEALALGKICIAHRCDSGHEEQITDGDNGFLLDFSAPDIAQKLQEILTMSDDRKLKMSERAKKRSNLGHQIRQQALAEFIKKLSLPEGQSP
jgi:glycosyltransferase involved in cell wall biosynthesis